MDLLFWIQQFVVMVVHLVDSLGFNFLDIVIVFVFFLYAFEGLHVGFIVAFVDFLSFIFAFVFGLATYTFVGHGLSALLGMPVGFANAFGFFLSSIICEIALSFFARIVLRSFMQHATRGRRADLIPLSPVLSQINHMFGFIPGLLSAFVLLSFLLSIVAALPFSAPLKNEVSSAPLASRLVESTQGFERNIKDIFGGAVTETVNFLTVKPESNEFIQLRFKTRSVSDDAEAEAGMLVSLNHERTSRGLPSLVADSALHDLATAHARDMFVRGYFSHYTPDGLSPFERMAFAGITYTHAGENLALAPNTALAMQGLMNSKGHRDNILSPDFYHVGIGVIDGGIYGKMFVQEFTN